MPAAHPPIQIFVQVVYIKSSVKIIVMKNKIFNQLIFTIVVLVCINTKIYSQILDKTFGQNGQVLYTVFKPSCSALQPDGKIIVGGGSSVARFNKDGSLDQAFSVINISPGGIYYLYNVIAIVSNSDGSFYTMGQGISNPFYGTICISKFFSSGKNDSSFGINGTSYTSLQDDNFYNSFLQFFNTSQIVIQSDGKILAGGTILKLDGGFSDYYQGVMVRYNKDGSPDTSFGNEGVILQDYSGDEEIDQIIFANDEKILSVGDYKSSSSVSRYNTDGSYDKSFGNNGIRSRAHV